MTRLATAVCALAALLTVAWGVPAGAADDDPCALLTRKEITRAFGQKAGAGSDELVPGLCQWRLAPTADRSPGQVNTLIERGKAATRDFSVASDLVGSEPVEGLGRKAVFLPDSGTVFVLTAGPTLFTVQGNVYDGEANRVTDGLKDLLTRLAARAEARV